MIRRTLILTVFILFIAGTAQAQRSYPSRAEKWEFSVQTAFTVGQEFKGDGGSSVKTEDSLGWGFGFAYNFNQYWNLGFGLGWRSMPYVATLVSNADPTQTSRYSSDLSISTIGLDGTWHVLKGKITPYATGRIGWTIVDTNILAGVGSGCWWDPWWGYVCGSVPLTYGKDVWTYAVGAGVRAELTRTFFLRGGYDYRRDSASSIKGTNAIRIDIGWMFETY